MQSLLYRAVPEKAAEEEITRKRTGWGRKAPKPVLGLWGKQLGRARRSGRGLPARVSPRGSGGVPARSIGWKAGIKVILRAAEGESLPGRRAEKAGLGHADIVIPRNDEVVDEIDRDGVQGIPQ